jgi:hypothetical protein
LAKLLDQKVSLLLLQLRYQEQLGQHLLAHCYLQNHPWLQQPLLLLSRFRYLLLQNHPWKV